MCQQIRKETIENCRNRKYAHVTFFFNGGVEAPNPGEDRALINSQSLLPTI